MFYNSSSAPDITVLKPIGRVQGQTQFWVERYKNFDNKNRLSTPNVIAELKDRRVVTLIGLVSQSNQANHLFSTYTVTNPSRVYNFSIDNGGLYQVSEPLLGCTSDDPTVQSNYLPRLADKLLDADVCDRVVIVPAAVGGSTVLDWSPSGFLHHIIPATLGKVKMAGLNEVSDYTFVLSHIGESDKIAGTSQENYISRANGCYNAILNFEGFNGKIFLTNTSLVDGATSDFVRNGQTAVINANPNIFFLGDTDVFQGSTYRDDGLHFNQNGSNSITNVFSSNLINYINANP